MSNLADLLKDIGDKNSTPVALIGDTIGTLADVAGGVGAIVALVGLFTGAGDQTEAELQNILSTMNADFAQLNADLRAENLILAQTNIANQVAAAQAQLGELTALINALPLSKEDRTTHIVPLLASLGALSPEVPIWEAVFAPQIYWSDPNQYFALNIFGQESDAGYGPQQPAQAAPNSDTVFAYVYVLPAYLYVLFAFLAVAGVIDPDFVKNYAGTPGGPLPDSIRGAANLLKGRHDTIFGGITQLSPGYWDGKSLWAYLAPLLIKVTPTPGSILWPGVSPIPPLLQPGQIGLPRGDTTGANIEYGAVEKFSGYSSMANYQLSFGTDIDPNSTDPSPFNKFQLRLLKRAKDVYTSVGLLHVWNTINSLRKIVGDAPSPRPNFADWSFKNDIIKVSKFPVPANRKVSLLAIAKFIKHTPPLDTDQRPSFTTSFRELLNH